MSMTRIEEIWLALQREARSSPLENGVFRLRRTSERTTLDIYAGVDSNHCTLIAIGLKNRPSQIDLKSSALQCFRAQRADKSWLQVLRLEQKGLEIVFGRLCQDLVNEAEEMQSEQALANLFAERLRAWKKLFDLTGGELLSLECIKGLIAELVVMNDLIGSSPPGDLRTISGGWVGPLGHDQDFILPQGCLEVKAVSPNASEVQISSLAQLASDQPLALWIVRLRSATGTPGAWNLNNLSSVIEGKLSEDRIALRTFRDRLIEAGYVEHPGYDSFCFTVTEIRRFQVTAAFPKLTVSNVPEGVSGATYRLSIEALQPFDSGLEQ